jgi:hypothetical protein
MLCDRSISFYHAYFLCPVYSLSISLQANYLWFLASPKFLRHSRALRKEKEPDEKPGLTKPRISDFSPMLFLVVLLIEL